MWRRGRVPASAEANDLGVFLFLGTSGDKPRCWDAACNQPAPIPITRGGVQGR